MFAPTSDAGSLRRKRMTENSSGYAAGYRESGSTMRREEGFEGQRMFVLPVETYKDYIDNPQVKRLYLTDVGYFPRAAGHFRERSIGIPENILLYCTEGKGSVWINGREYVLRPGQAFCIPRFRSHYYYADEKEPWSILWVHFAGTDADFYPLADCRIITFTSAHATNRMSFLFDLLFRVLEGTYTLGNFIYISQVLALLLAEIYVREKKEDTDVRNKHVTDMVRYMYTHISEEISLEKLCGQVKLSKSYVNSIFYKCTGHSPVDFLIRIRMREACKLLRMSDAYIYEVARSVGYQDQYYFSRVFKKVVGVSPKEYRENEYFFYQ